MLRLFKVSLCHPGHFLNEPVESILLGLGEKRLISIDRLEQLVS